MAGRTKFNALYPKENICSLPTGGADLRRTRFIPDLGINNVNTNQTIRRIYIFMLLCFGIGIQTFTCEHALNLPLIFFLIRSKNTFDSFRLR